MQRMLVVVVLLGLTGAPEAAAAEKRLPRLSLPRPDVVGLVQLLDELTRRPDAPSVNARLRAILPRHKLQVASTDVEVTVRRGERSWRGRVVAVIDVPTTVRYTVDLGGLGSHQLRWDPARRVLRVALPPVQVESVSPSLSEVTVKHRYHGWRLAMIDESTAEDLERAALREDYEPAARQAAEEQLPAVRSQARAEVQDLLQRYFRAALADVVVVVD